MDYKPRDRQNERDSLEDRFTKLECDSLNMIAYIKVSFDLTDKSIYV